MNATVLREFAERMVAVHESNGDIGNVAAYNPMCAYDLAREYLRLTKPDEPCAEAQVTALRRNARLLGENNQFWIEDWDNDYEPLSGKHGTYVAAWEDAASRLKLTENR